MSCLRPQFGYQSNFTKIVKPTNILTVLCFYFIGKIILKVQRYKNRECIKFVHCFSSYENALPSLCKVEHYLQNSGKQKLFIYVHYIRVLQNIINILDIFIAPI